MIKKNINKVNNKIKKNWKYAGDKKLRAEIAQFAIKYGF